MKYSREIGPNNSLKLSEVAVRLVAASLLLVVLLLVVVVGCESKSSEETKPNGDPQAEQDEGGLPPADGVPISSRWANEEELLAEAPEIELKTREIKWLNDEVFLIDVPKEATVQGEYGEAECQLPSGAKMELRVRTRNLVEMKNDMRHSSLVKEIPFAGQRVFLWKSGWTETYMAEAQFTDSVRDYVASVSEAESLSDCILLLKCLQSYRPKDPYPEQLVELLSRLGVGYQPESDDPKKITELRFGYGDEPCARQFLLLSRFPNLESLYIEGLRFGPQEQSLEPLLELSKLQSFVTATNLHDGQMETLAQIPTLRRLDVHAAMYTSESWFKSLGRMSGLTRLSLEGIDDKTFVIGLRHLVNCKELQDVTLLQAYLPGEDITPFEESLQVLSELPKLQKLTLRSITGPICERIGSLESLESLEIRNLGQITVENFATLAKAPNLKSLTMDGNLVFTKPEITPEGIKQLGTAKALEALKISDLPLGEDDFAAISQLPNLVELTLDAEFLTPMSLTMLQDAPKLRKLELIGAGFNNKLTKDVMNEFKKAAPQIELVY